MSRRCTVVLGPLISHDDVSGGVALRDATVDTRTDDIHWQVPADAQCCLEWNGLSVPTHEIAASLSGRERHAERGEAEEASREAGEAALEHARKCRCATVGGDRTTTKWPRGFSRFQT